MVVWMGLSAPPIGGWLVDFDSCGVQVLWGLFFEQFHRTCPFPIVSVRCILIIIIIIIIIIIFLSCVYPEII